METNKNKKILDIVLDDDVRKLTIEGKNGNQEVVMREELSDDELDSVAGGANFDLSKCNSFDQEAFRSNVKPAPKEGFF